MLLNILGVRFDRAIKQGECWKVFPDMSDWDFAEQAAKDKVESYKKLEAWFKARKAKLKKGKGEQLRVIFNILPRARSRKLTGC